MMRPSAIARTARQSPGLCRQCSFMPVRPLHTAKAIRATTSNSTAPPQLARRSAGFQLRQQALLAKRYRSSDATTDAAAAAAAAEASSPPTEPTADSSASDPSTKKLPDLSKLSGLVMKSRERFLSTDGIPTDQLVLAALRTCQGAANAIHPYLSRASSQTSGAASSSASHLLSLSPDGSASPNAQKPKDVPALLRQTVDAITESAFAIMAHDPVIITPEALSLYVHIQARINRPETLPHVLELYASKPKPQVVNGAIEYVEQNPKKADKAIPVETADNALNAAMEARNLDAALGIVQCCYASKAFVRQKLLNKALFPAAILTGAPFGVYGISSALSTYQNTVEAATATKAAFAAILAYLAFTSTIGTIAKVTSDDHMRRVSWAPGITLSQRWLREEERAALDEVACAWGYKETWRHGEEGGVEWEALREYLGLKGMILDRVEFMEGMS